MSPQYPGSFAGLRLLFTLFVLALIPGSVLRAGSVLFNYTLPSAAKTSAGVFTADGTLLRTLWSNQSDPAGVNSAIWNGLDDHGQPLSPGGYVIKVLHSQVSYTWEGVLGNTSTAQTGLTVRRAYYPIHDLAISGTNMLFVTGYNEMSAVFHRSGTATPNAVDHWGPADYWRTFSLAATDGTRMYFANSSERPNCDTFITAFNVSDNSAAVFTNGTAAEGNSTKWTSVIDRVTAPVQPAPPLPKIPVSIPTGLAVQSASPYLFVARAVPNELRVYNKTSGASVATFAVTAPDKIVVTRDDLGLWVIATESGNRVVRRYAIDSAGNLSATTAVITGLSAPLALAVSPDNTTLLVADGGASQQVKAFTNASSGTLTTPLWTLGQAGGYATNGPAVANDKFHFMLNNQGYAIRGTYLAYQSDGSFWVGDPGNERSLRFSAARAYLDRIMYLSHNYVSTACVGENTRVFARGWLEFAVDYNQPPHLGWTLVKNWSGTMSDADAALQDKNGLHTVIKMSNGRTYGVINVTISNQPSSKVYELTSTGLRDCGVILGAQQRLHDDSTLRWAVKTNTGKMEYYKRTLTGFDASHNPQWGSNTLIGSTPVTSLDPETNTGGRGAKQMVHPETSTGLTIVADGRGDGHYNFHLGALSANGTKFKWKTARGARYFDGHGSVGAYCWYPNNNAYVSGRHVILACHGEGYVNPRQNTTQAGQFLHYWDSGLMVGQFGSPLNEIFNPNPVGVVAGQAGNAFSPVFIAVGANHYLWVNDEFGASGLHRWKVNNSSSVAELSFNVVLPAGANGTGLTGEFFSGSNFDTLVAGGTDAVVDFNWAAGSPASGVPTDNFSARWTGLVQPVYSETYAFSVSKEDYARLWINGTLVADGWNTSGGTATGTYAMTAGQKYQLLLEYRETTGNASVSLKWQSPSQALQVVPFQQLFPSNFVAFNQAGTSTNRFMTDPQGIPLYSYRSTTSPISTAGVFDPAPLSVYQIARRSWIDIGLIDLEPFTNYRVRTHLAEIESGVQTVGARVFNALVPSSINYPEPTVLAGIDIFASAGAVNTAVTKEFVLSTDTSGHLRFGFKNTSALPPLVSAVEIYRDTSSTPAFTSVGTGTGLKGDYFSDTALTTLATTRIDPEINFDWTGISPVAGVASSNYSVRWSGQILTAEPGDYTFLLNHDNGGRLWVNNTLIIDQWGTTGAHNAAITLAGYALYDIKVEYYQSTGAGNVTLQWKRPTIVANQPHSWATIPRSQFYYTPAVDLVVDNADTTGVMITGAWVNSTALGTMGTLYGPNHCHDLNAGKGTKSVRFTPNLPSAGIYEVFVRWTSDASRATSVPVSITHPGGTTNFSVNQQTQGGEWVSFGRYSFNAGTGGYVLVSNTGTTGHVDADAVRFVKY